MRTISYVLLVLLLASCASKPKEAPLAEKVSNVAQEAGFMAPLEVQSQLEIDHKYFKITYDPGRRLPLYVVYELTDEKLRKSVASRKNKFKVDPYLSSKKIPLVKPAEYLNSGYDKGHLAPSADFAFSQDANDLTFVMSNMAPQKGNLNQDAWRRLEDKIRRWACGEKKVTVITGLIFGEKMKTLRSGLVVPPSFYKIVIDETPPRKMQAFIYHQTDKGDVLKERTRTLEEINAVVGKSVKGSLASLTQKVSRLPASNEKWKEADCSKSK